MTQYENIKIAGGDTAKPINLNKRIQTIVEEIDSSGKTFFDLGCGAGEYVAALLIRGENAHGVEFDPLKVESFKTSYPQYSTRVEQGDIQQTGLQKNSVDVVLMNEVLEHVPNQNQALREAFRILRPGGVLLVFSPNRLYPFETHGVKLKKTGRDLPIYLPLIPYIPLRVGTLFFDYWARNYWPNELRDLLRQNGFRIRRYVYLWPTFENISGRQPGLITKIRPILQVFSSLFEKIPIIRSFGVSQFISAEKLDPL